MKDQPVRKTALEIENELLKMKLNMQHGADIWKGADLDPELENQWLKNIIEFEDQFEDCSLIKLYDYIGCPEFKPADEIAENDFNMELERLYKIMEENNVSFGSICHYEGEELYRFVTTELFNHEMNDVRIPGMTMCFLYEDFSPTMEHSVKCNAMVCVKHLLEDNYFPEYMLAEEINSLSGLINKEHAITRINHFRQAFTSFSIIQQKVDRIEVINETARVDLILTYDALISGTSVQKRFSGSGVFNFNLKDNYWSIKSMSIPGFRL